MSMFPTSKHFASGLDSRRRTVRVAGRKNTRIGRAGTYIKPLLVQCSLNAIRSKPFPQIWNRYLELKNAGATKSHHCQNTSDRDIQHAQEEQTVLYKKTNQLPVHRAISVDKVIFRLQ